MIAFTDEKRKYYQVHHVFVWCTSLMASELREVYIKYYSRKSEETFERYLHNRDIGFVYSKETEITENPIWITCWKKYKVKEDKQ